MLSFKIFLQNRKFFATAFLYSCFSLIFSTWVTYIPFIAEKLNITEGKIGSALFFTSLGSLSMLPISNRMVDRLGVGRQVFLGFIMYFTARPKYPLSLISLTEVRLQLTGNHACRNASSV